MMYPRIVRLSAAYRFTVKNTPIGYLAMRVDDAGGAVRVLLLTGPGAGRLQWVSQEALECVDAEESLEETKPSGIRVAKHLARSGRTEGIETMMADVRTTIAAALRSTQIAIDGMKSVTDTESLLERATRLKRNEAALLGLLGHVKTALLALQTHMAAKENGIAKPRAILGPQPSLVRRGEAYYERDSDGRPRGKPFCPRCWEGGHRKRELLPHPLLGGQRVCTACKRVYDARTAGVRA